ncbi:MAG: NUDIX domain-containing protein [Deltaproteobacteria bacterium]|nr:NUDIX domain-containing protein [Deltaproteobacteria bacterium]
MELRQFSQPIKLENVPAGILGFDLEMANSFPRESPVICMVGLEHYDPEEQVCHSYIATITNRTEEKELVSWFLDFLAGFTARNAGARLLTFSGSDNDIPWMTERIERYGIDSEAHAFNSMDHLDLRVEFQRRTQTNRISLKRLEEVFGIQRETEISSKKVSYLLTDLIRGRNNGGIPEKLFRYLSEDVHHLLLILDQWDSRPLAEHFLGEFDYINQAISLLKLSRRLAGNARPQPDSRGKGGLAAFNEALGEQLEKAVAQESLKEFQLPRLPQVSLRTQDGERIEKKFKALCSLEIHSDNHGYRLTRQLKNPKGTLAVVRKNGKVLMIRRGRHLERAPDMWGLPGGELEKGEGPAGGAARELLEELNLKGRPLQILGAQQSVTGPYELFWVELDVPDHTSLAPKTDEVAEVRWVSPGELGRLEPLIPGTLEGFRDFLGADWGRAAHLRGKKNNGGQ